MTEVNLTSMNSKPIAVLGAGVTGASVIRHLDRHGCAAVWLDTRSEQASADMSERVQWDTRRWPGVDVDYAVVSPGLELDACLVAGARAAGVHLLSDIDLFFASVDAPVIGVTGTNGKSTVTSLVGHLLNAGGVSCGVGGNLGFAALDIIAPDHVCYVLELSSFQLERSAEHNYAAATILNISEDHIDKHGSMQDYVSSKHRLYSASSRLIFNRADSLTHPKSAEVSSTKIGFGLDQPNTEDQWGICQVDDQRWFCQGQQPICPVAAMPLVGAHNELNVLAAFALVAPWLSHAQMAAALATFDGLAHRFAHVDTIAGVRYVNDSKATNLGATVAALAGLPEDHSLVLIAGGDAKGVDLSPLHELLRNRAHQVIAIGRDAQQIVAAAELASVDIEVAPDLPAAVRIAHDVANQGDLVLLSPACASLDMFKNYAERGDVFVATVAQIAGEVH